MPLWRGFAGVQTLHPQWGGYSLTWQREAGPRRAGAPRARRRIRPRSAGKPVCAADAGGAIPPRARLGWPSLRRRLSGPERQLDFPVLERLAAAGATDYFAQIVRFGPPGDPSYGSGMGYSFATDRAGGFTDDDLRLIEAVLPAASLAIMSDTGHGIASGLLAAYLGEDAGRRVHAGAVERGSVESIRAALCFADIRGFTAIADALPGLVLVELLDEVFETVIAPLRAARRPGAEIPRRRHSRELPVRGAGARAPPAAGRSTPPSEAIAGLDRLGASRRDAGKPAASVDFALHVGEVSYGNVGAVDRLDFTVIGPAVNEVARIEVLCEPLGRNLLVSAEFAAAARRQRPPAAARPPHAARRARAA